MIKDVKAGFSSSPSVAEVAHQHCSQRRAAQALPPVRPARHRVFDREGHEIEGLRVIGFQDADSFVAVLDKALNVP